jgi:hypothetical protein
MEKLMYNNAIIEIQNDTVLVTYMADGAAVNSTVLTLHDFVEIVKAADTKIETPMFSTNTFKYKLDGSYESLFVFSPPSRVDLKFGYGDSIEVFKNAYFPSFYMEVMFTTSGRYNGSSVRMLKDVHSITEMVSTGKNIKDYRMIFPNVYEGSNKICWGSTLYNITITRETAGNLLDIFKTSHFNNDLFGTTLSMISSRVPGIVSVQDYFRWLTTIDSLPDELYF